jgi:hypothetical protein
MRAPTRYTAVGHGVVKTDQHGVLVAYGAYAELLVEIDRLRKAGDILAFHYTALGRKVYGDDPLPSSITDWLEARKTK